jgi:hypothetical protein
MLIKLTNTKDEKILIGTESIIGAEPFILKPQAGGEVYCTRIRSRGAMVETFYVHESVDQIYNLVNQSA